MITNIVLEVVFTNRRLSLDEIKILNLKTYRFKCNDSNVAVHSLITDSRYDKKIQVINITDFTYGERDRDLKYIVIDNIDNTISQDVSSHIDKERQLNVTIEQAREWYNSDNDVLKNIALSIYTEQEINFNFKYLSDKVDKTTITLKVPVDEFHTSRVISKLTIIAKYFNKEWKKNSSNKGFCIKKAIGTVARGCERILGNDYYVFTAYTLSPGTVYFKSGEDAEKAFKLLKNDIISMF